jgi:hypothetical protein
LEEWLEDGYLSLSSIHEKEFRILLDHKTLKELLKHGVIDAFVSFQVRTVEESKEVEKLAVVRLFEPSRRKAQNHDSGN